MGKSSTQHDEMQGQRKGSGQKTERQERQTEKRGKCVEKKKITDENDYQKAWACFASHLGWEKYKNSGQHFKAKTNILLAAEAGRGISRL